jgi:hypothetical protein
MTMIDPKGSRPAMLAKFAEAVRDDDGTPVREGVESAEETAPVPTPNLDRQPG